MGISVHHAKDWGRCASQTDLLYHPFGFSTLPSGTTQLTLSRKSGSLCTAISYEFAQTHAG
jgi:hypothetical protein